jgi:serine/threonine protein kinase
MDISGRVVSHYRILDQLDGGGMGVVFLGEDVRLGRRVALKFLPPHLLRDAQQSNAFSAERAPRRHSITRTSARSTTSASTATSTSS